MTEGNVMEDWPIIRWIALGLAAWVFVSAPIGVILGKAIHAAQHEAGAPIASDAADHQA